MTRSRPVRSALVLPILVSAALVSAVPASAQTEDPPPTPRRRAPATATSGADRLFLSFAEEAAVIDTQWWEGQFEYLDGDGLDATIGRIVIAMQPFSRVEVGGRVGFGSTDTPPSLPDGSGATDLDVWGKWHLGTANRDTDFALGALVTVPTGDDTAGLGNDSFDLEAFGSVRYRLDAVILSGVAGVRVNGDGQRFGGKDSPQGFETQGKTSTLIGAGALYPLSDTLTLAGELRMETERFENADSDLRFLAGANWRPFNRGILRGAVALGVTDGAPDAQLLAGYAYVF